jgi:hypothetical protein
LNNIERVRFKDDTEDVSNDASNDDIWKVTILAQYSRHSLEINNYVTPKLEEVVKNALVRLDMNRELVVAFVYASSEIEARSLTLDGEKCLIGLSSSLINLLDDDELQFVVGHELGHFIFKHKGHNQLTINGLMSGYRLSRSQEISADRIGFIAAGDISACARALIKTSSGLSGDKIRFDVSAYLKQFENLDNMKGADDSFRTHPSLLIRTKSLLLFSLDYEELKNSNNLETILSIRKRIDTRVELELSKYTEPERALALEKSKQQLEFWYFALAILKSGKLTKEIQEKVKIRFGTYYLNKLISVFSNTDQADLLDTLNHFIIRTEKELFSIVGNEFQDIVSEVKKISFDTFNG